MSNFTIDFFELAFLVEACIPPRPIARSMFFDDVSDIHYHKMTKEERQRLFDWISPKLDLENENCRYFYARFNPKNQYLLSCFYHRKTEEIECFRFDDRYHTSKNTFINPEYIKSASLINPIL
jgi:hypothetical protein